MARIRPVLSLLALAAAAAALPAQACSAPHPERPTNLALAAGADAIVLGQVVGGTGDASPEASITVHPLAAIKGLLPGQDFLLHGMHLATGGLAPSDPNELEAPHPDALSGACLRTRFAPGATVLFFLDRRDGEWAPAGGPFTRWAEDVPDEDAPWVQLTVFYVRVAPLPEDQRRALLESERDALREHADEPAAVALAADLERELAAPPLPDATVAESPNDGFREPGEVSAVQRALDRMRADRDDP